MPELHPSLTRHQFVGISKTARRQPAPRPANVDLQAHKAAVAVEPPPDTSPLELVFCIGGEVQPGVMVQPFDEAAPEAASALRVRLTGMEGAAVDSVTPGACVELAADVAPLVTLTGPPMRHDRRGLVTLARAGGRLCLLLSAQPGLDRTHVACGLVTSGLETVEALSQLPSATGRPDAVALLCCSGASTPSATPAQRQAMLLAVQAKAQRLHASAVLRAETRDQTRARVERESAAARGAVTTALGEALRRQQTAVKRDRPTAFGLEGDPSESEDEECGT